MCGLQFVYHGNTLQDSITLWWNIKLFELLDVWKVCCDYVMDLRLSFSKSNKKFIIGCIKIIQLMRENYNFIVICEQVVYIHGNLDFLEITVNFAVYR